MLRSIVKPAAVLFIICLAVTASLAVTWLVTGDTIRDRAEADAVNARKAVLKQAESFEKIDDLKLKQIIEKAENLDSVREAYVAFDGENVAGYVVTVVTKGYGGDMALTVGIDARGTITGVRIGENSETPGLGSKAKDDRFRSQLEGFKPGQALKVVKGGKTRPEEIDAISGATVTSRAVVRGVQAAVDLAGLLREEEGANI